MSTRPNGGVARDSGCTLVTGSLLVRIRGTIGTDFMGLTLCRRRLLFQAYFFIGSLVYKVTLTPARKRDFLTLCINSLLGPYGFSLSELLSTHDSPMCVLVVDPKVPGISTQLAAQFEKRVDAIGEQPSLKDFSVISTLSCFHPTSPKHSS